MYCVLKVTINRVNYVISTPDVASMPATFSPNLTIVMMAQKGQVINAQTPPTIADDHWGMG